MRQQEDLQYWETSRAYIDGNTARELAAQVAQRKEQIHQEYVEQQEEEREQRRRERQTRAAVQKNSNDGCDGDGVCLLSAIAVGSQQKRTECGRVGEGDFESEKRQ